MRNNIVPEPLRSIINRFAADPANAPAMAQALHIEMLRIALELRPCQHPACTELSTCGCDGCDKRFCSDHGSKGGDRQVEDVGAVAYPSACWECGGFNVDEGICLHPRPVLRNGVPWCELCGDFARNIETLADCGNPAEVF